MGRHGNKDGGFDWWLRLRHKEEISNEDPATKLEARIRL